MYVGTHSDDNMNRWTDGRMILIGDAAHAIPPHLGQGTAMALEDSVSILTTVYNGEEKPITTYRLLWRHF